METLLLWLAFGIGCAFGLIARTSRFCTLGALADIVSMGDWNRMRMWLLAIGTAILGAAALHAAGLINLDQSFYRTPALAWLAHLTGGLCFGAGMALASGCAAQTLIRIGGGNLKSLIVALVLALFALITLRGFLGIFRVRILEKTLLVFPGGQDLPALLTAAGMPPAPALALAALGVGGALLTFALAKREFRTANNLLGGFGIGLSIVAAWYVSGHLGYLAEDPETLQENFIATASGRMEALSFVAPLAHAQEFLAYGSDSARKMTLGIAGLMGVITGGALSARLTRSFRWETFTSVADTLRHLVGAALMGFGGITAMGCTIGQGISGLSTLALGSILTFLAILLGAVGTLKGLECART